MEVIAIRGVEKIDYMSDAKAVAQYLLDHSVSVVTVGLIGRILKTSNSYRILAVRSILVDAGVIGPDRRVNIDMLKKFLSS